MPQDAGQALAIGERFSNHLGDLLGQLSGSLRRVVYVGFLLRISVLDCEAVQLAPAVHGATAAATLDEVLQREFAVSFLSASIASIAGQIDAALRLQVNAADHPRHQGRSHLLPVGHCNHGSVTSEFDQISILQTSPTSRLQLV
jgi:hypothetical protein